MSAPGAGSPFRVDHVGVVVPDLDAAVAFFVDVLGFRPVREATIGGPDDPLEASFGVPDGARVRTAFVETDGGMVELLEWSDVRAAADARAPQDVGTAHLALSVPDVEAAAARLAGVPGVRVFRRHRRGFVYVFAPWGLLLQLVERPA